MKQDIKTQWVAALRSRRYRQGRHTLHNFDDCGVERFCCLGVLCDLAVKAGACPSSGFGYGKYNNHDTLPLEVRQWAGLRTDNPKAQSVYGQARLADLNDKGTPFATLADLIERQL